MICTDRPEFAADCAVFGWFGCCAVLSVLLELGLCCAWLLAGGGLLVWACEGEVVDPPGCVEPEGVVVCACEEPLDGVVLEGEVCACEELLDGAVLEGEVCACEEPLGGAVLEGEVCACEEPPEGVALEGEVCACDGVLDDAAPDWLVVVVEFVEPDGRLCAGVDDEVDVSGFAVVLLGDWAKAAVARMRPTAVLRNSCFFMRELLSIETLRSRTTESPACRFRVSGTAGH